MPSPSSLPLPVRAALGLAVTVLDEARHLPDKAIELPMRAISRALAMSLRAQQHYAALAARGDDVISGRRTSDEPPAWARFDDADADDAFADALPDALPDAGPDAAPDALTDATFTLPVGKSTQPTRPKPRPAKTVRAPRIGATSAFDAVEEPEA